MRILYGVQATGNGHISRARAMARAFEGLDVEIVWVFSGRERDQLFDMAPFGDFLHCRGLTFATEAGRIRYRRTLSQARLWQFRRDVRTLPVRGFDLVVTDFEPVVARAGRRAGIPTIGIGHQYAFGGDTPTPAGHWLARRIMQAFAPVDRGIGLHWHPYGRHVLPPILDLPALDIRAKGHIVVYLPFEDTRHVVGVLQQCPEQRFELFGPALPEAVSGNVHLHPARVATFKQALAGCSGVICNSGFELVSECLQWRKPVLTRPLRGQLEQLANAMALRELGYATVTAELTADSLAAWHARPNTAPTVHFPDVAAALARWLADGARSEPDTLQPLLWGHTLSPPQNPRNALGKQPAMG
ncbi:glycosyltransferase family protein [Haliea sp.]|uniref:glycosyltransferase family protein n=1 Tax=Haliea sp. TaxID=1932666 RepID=UPI0035274C75